MSESVEERFQYQTMLQEWALTVRLMVAAHRSRHRLSQEQVDDLLRTPV